MRNPFTEAEEYDFRQSMMERKQEQDRQMREDALDAIDSMESEDD